MFHLRFGEQIIAVTKIREEDFTTLHHNTLERLRFENGKLLFPNPDWRSLYLGAGEEKAVFCVCDESRRVFAVELIDEPHYLNGRFVGGQYFFSKRVQALHAVRANASSEFGLTFSGLVKVREFVHGYEWSRFQFDPRKQTMIDNLLTTYLQSTLGWRFKEIQAHYKDVHERNVLFEIGEFNQPGIPIILRTWIGILRIARIRLQAIDVR